MKIAFCSSEMVPFVKTGGLADVSGSLPLALQKLGVEVYLFLPRYKYIDYEVHHIKRIDDHISQGFFPSRRDSMPRMVNGSGLSCLPDRYQNQTIQQLCNPFV